MDRSDDLSFRALRSLLVAHWRPNVVSTVLRILSMVFVALHPYLLAQLVTSVDDRDRALRFLGVAGRVGGHAHAAVDHLRFLRVEEGDTADI